MSRNWIFVLALFIFVHGAVAIPSYMLMSAHYTVEISIGLSAGSGTMGVHVPVSNDMQTVTQESDYGLSSDELGQYFETSGPATFIADVAVDASKIKILSNPDFPIDAAGIPSEYLGSSAKIQSNDSEIKAKALEIIGNASTELEAVSRVVKWVNKNINYKIVEDLIGKRSSKEVLQGREGVCGDFSVLTAAFLRSAGVPAKYVSGLLYTEDGGSQSHAWLEFYVPGSGWVPIDPTNGKMMPDASLIKIMEGANPDVMADTITYQSSKPVFSKDLSAEIGEYSVWSGLFSSSLAMEPKEVGESAYTKARLTIKNLKNYYLVPFIKFYLSVGLKTDDPLLFKVVEPYAEEKVQINVLTPGNLSRDYKYTHFVHAAGPGISANDSFVISFENAAGSKSGDFAVKNVEKDIRDNSIVIMATVENSGKTGANVSVSLVSDGGQEKKIVFVGAGQSALASFEVGRTAQRNFYNFTVILEAEGIMIAQPVYVQVKEEAILQNVQQFVTDNFAFVIVGVLCVIVLIVGFVFLSPYIYEPKKPFEEGRGIKVTKKKIFDEEETDA